MLLALLACTPAAPPHVDAPVPTVQLGVVEATTPALFHAGLYAADGFGHDPHEPVGPWAVFADGDGVSVLDQVNARIVRLDAEGHRLGTVPIPSASTFDAVATDDGYGLLTWTQGDDPHWSVQTIGTEGTLFSDTRVALDPPTAVFPDGDRLLVEDRHDDTVDVATGERFPGRPTGDGRYVKARKEGIHAVILTWSDGGDDVRSVRLDVDRPVVNVLSMDAQGDHVVLSLLLMEVTTDEASANPEIRVVDVDRLGHRRRELRFDAGVGVDANRPFAVTAAGRIVQLRPTNTDVGLWGVK